MFTFTPRTDEQIEALANKDLLPKGQYEFKVLNIEKRVSGSGNDMLAIKLLIVQGNDSRTLMDYIVMTDKWAFKLKHFCESVGFHKVYEKGEANLISFEGQGGTLKLDIQKGTPKQDGSGNYADKNVVTDYVPNALAKEIKDIFNDEIPF